MSKSKKRVKESSSIRVGVDLLMRLSAYRDRLVAAARKRPGAYPPNLNRSKAGLEDAIAYLLYQDDCHQQRGRAYRQRRTADMESCQTGG